MNKNDGPYLAGIIVGVAVTLLACYANKALASWELTYTPYSYHLNDDVDYNEDNHAVGFRYDNRFTMSYTAHNSYDKKSLYVLYQPELLTKEWKYIRVGLNYGFATGYDVDYYKGVKIRDMDIGDTGIAPVVGASIDWKVSKYVWFNTMANPLVVLNTVSVRF